jgi:DNA processing protein
MEKSPDWVRRVLAQYFAPLEFPDLDAKAETILQWCERDDVHLIAPDAFPLLLRETPDPPPWLFIKGSLEAFTGGIPLALVGTRRPCAYGLRAAHHFSRALVQAGATLVSGLARGIDAVAHGAAVLAGRPTVAVLAHGLDRIYPADNRGLSRQILDCGGCLVSEYPPGVTARPYFFPRRNRILSGLCHGTLVVEAGAKSGSLTTARHALDQNREVFVVPGPYYEPGFAGSHWLLQQGAKLVVCAEQVWEELAPGILPVESARPDDENSLRVFLRTHGIASLEEILNATGDEPRAVRAAIELARQQGWVVETAPQCFVYAGN